MNWDQIKEKPKAVQMPAAGARAPSTPGPATAPAGAPGANPPGPAAPPQGGAPTNVPPGGNPPQPKQ